MKTKIPADVRNIIAEMERLLQALKVKLEDLAAAQGEYRAGAYAGSLSNRPLRTPPPPRVHPTLGTL